MIADLKGKVTEIDRCRLYTAVSVFAIAGTTGFFMQGGTTAPASAPRMAVTTMAPAAMPDPVAEVTRGDLGSALDLRPFAETPDADTDVLASVSGPAAPGLIDTREDPELMAVLDDAPADTLRTPAAPAEDILVMDCTVHLSAEPVPGALVALSLIAPCNSGEDVEFNSDGLRFSERLGPDGELEVLVPAVAAQARFAATLSDAQAAISEVSVPDFADFERIALIWQGGTGLQLHALENGASYGEPGHVWAEQPSGPGAAVAGTGGFVSVLGSISQGFAADIYTFPVGMMATGAGPEISIEAQVMENTCGTQIEGSILHVNTGRAPTVLPLSIAVPGCEAVGEYLVLKNLPQNLKLAAN